MQLDLLPTAGTIAKGSVLKELSSQWPEHNLVVAKHLRCRGIFVRHDGNLYHIYREHTKDSILQKIEVLRNLELIMKAPIAHNYCNPDFRVKRLRKCHPEIQVPHADDMMTQASRPPSR